MDDFKRKAFSAATPTSDELADIDLAKVAHVMHPNTAVDFMKALVESGSSELLMRNYKIHGLPVFITIAITEDKMLAADFS